MMDQNTPKQKNTPTLFIPPQIARPHKRKTGLNGKHRASSDQPYNFSTTIEEDTAVLKKPRRSTPSTGPREKSAASSSEQLDETYLEQLVCGLELHFTDWVLDHVESREWLTRRQRQINGEDGYIHLSAFLESNIFARMKPTVTQMALRRSLMKLSSEGYLELSPDTYHVRRRPSTSPARPNAEAMHSGFWDQKTVYVEPHVSSISLSPAKLAHHLTAASNLPSNILPIQHVDNPHRHPSYAFIMLSDDVDESIASDSRHWPQDWIVMTKKDWRRRTEELSFQHNSPPTTSLSVWKMPDDQIIQG
ncbi:hypothetical protein L228DRAFT_262746 [Xylona heveae TC161]|uniref:Winged helix DNA-binding domain-containing protein n=1 Tax=Xylona heveae (strain CBS 132557 / TC161) TaxID=1328760 RepID=A0A165FE28_XYLHT|nr:hypothetical protein L228DRAFT_262746 [Xylona heveae TC161]KZF20871.1 hypothetical protein L228DRAFT_262746 [Xylona heveae TC161]